MEKTIRWILIGIVIIFTIKAFFNHSLSRKAEIEITKLEAERNNLKRMLGDHQVKIEALKRDTAELAALINLTYQDIQKKENALTALKIKIKSDEKKYISVVKNYRSVQLDSVFRVRFPVPDSLYNFGSETGRN